MGDTKKKYSADELLQYAYKHNQIPVILFAKDKDCRYIYTSEVEDLIDGGKEKSILGKTDMDIQYDEKLGQLYYDQDKDIMRTGNPCHCYSEFDQDGKCDCNNLKMINDKYGHEAGDRYICQAADMLGRIVSDKSIVIRWGGDEFLIITPSCSEQMHETLLGSIKDYREKVSDIEPDTGLAVGGALRTRLETSEKDIIKTADARMYSDKALYKKQHRKIS